MPSREPVLELLAKSRRAARLTGQELPQVPSTGRGTIAGEPSVGQEGLDFHTYCHAVVHWNLPSNPMDLEQREDRVHRYKGHVIRKPSLPHRSTCVIVSRARLDPGPTLVREQRPTARAKATALHRSVVAFGWSIMAELNTYACGLVRYLELLPHLSRAPQREQGSPRVSFGQIDRSLSMRNHRTQHAASIARRNFLELAAAAAGLAPAAVRTRTGLPPDTPPRLRRTAPAADRLPLTCRRLGRRPTGSSPVRNAGLSGWASTP